jgi:C4-dicarboxylate transporter, DctQ subunit
MSTRSPDPAGSIDDLLGRLMQAIENTLLTVIFVAMVVVGLIELVAAHLAGWSPTWTADLLQALLLWLIMAGSMVASGRLKHARITLAEHILSPSQVTAIHRIVFMLAALACLALTWYGIQLVALEHDFRQVAFGMVPNWVVLIAVPIGFGIMGARFAAWGLIPPETTSRPSGAET